jgi:hypothetical protein
MMCSAPSPVSPRQLQHAEWKLKAFLETPPRVGSVLDVSSGCEDDNEEQSPNRTLVLRWDSSPLNSDEHALVSTAFVALCFFSPQRARYRRVRRWTWHWQRKKTASCPSTSRT